MADISTTYSEMTDAATKLTNGKQEMETILTNLGSLIDGLTSSGFVTDHASGAYADAFHQFKTGTTTAIDALDGLASFLNQAAQSFSETDTQLANSIPQS